ncbi:hypothetical protein GJAV_G00189110 [Gymnothorax javanicus]|nr:hypothetical protein GJAV_G00189110 [Gymnothorax javanicus]
MELKVSVDGVQRIVCGVTDKTTCQEVVIVLAQALGRTGRYTLMERYKDFERNVAPDERLLESLTKYGQHSRQVRLILLHNGPSAGGGGGDVQRRGSHQVCAQLRRGDFGGRGQRGSDSRTSRRQSLPSLTRFRLRPEPPETAEAKKPKRKSLTLVEEAFGWLENLSRGGKLHRGREKERESEKSKVSPTSSKDCRAPGGARGMGCQKRTAGKPGNGFLKVFGGKREDNWDNNDNHSDEANKYGDASRDQELNTLKTKAERKLELKAARKARVSSLLPLPPIHKTEEERLRALLVQQQARLQDLQSQLDSTEAQIQELEETQTVRLHPEAGGGAADEEPEEGELPYWQNELRAEEVYERDLQEQFLEMKQKAAECKAKLEEYKSRLQGLDLIRGKRITSEAEADSRKESTAAVQKPIFRAGQSPTPASSAAQPCRMCTTSRKNFLH